MDMGQIYCVHERLIFTQTPALSYAIHCSPWKTFTKSCMPSNLIATAVCNTPCHDFSHSFYMKFWPPANTETPNRIVRNQFLAHRSTGFKIHRASAADRTSLYGSENLRFYDAQSYLPLRGRFTQLIEKNEEGGRYAGQAPFVKARQAANDVDENLQNKKARREKQGPRERERCRRKGLCESERESVRRRWRRRRRVISRRTDGSSISPACYSRSDGMFINRLISEIGVRLRTIAGADSSIAIKRKSIISIWPLCVCRTFRHARLYIRPRRAYIPIDRAFFH